MSTSRQSGGGGVQEIPAGSRRIVQSLKEIVACSEAEIYDALKECNMDPNEAVDRLLNQDPFHEVKKKREKKKEAKEATESRPRGGSNASSRGGRIGSDRYLSRCSSTQYNSSESVNFHGKSSSHTKENGSTPHTSFLSSKYATLGINRSRGSPGPNDGAFAESKVSSWGTSYAIAHDAHPPSGYQSAWGGGHGQVSVADIVKMGRPHGAPSNGRNAPHHHVQVHSTAASHSNLRSHEEQASKEHWLENSLVPPRSTDDEWPTIEKPVTMKVTSSSGYNADSEQHPEASVGQYSDEEEIVQEIIGENAEISGENDMESDSIVCGKMTEEVPRGVSKLENNLYEDMGSYQHQSHNFEHDGVEAPDASMSSVTKNMQQLSVDEEAQELLTEECAPSLIIPDHLKVHSADCSHLSFGSFGSGMKISFSSGAMTSIPVKSHLGEAHSDADIGHPETRSSEYYVKDSPRHASDGSLFHRGGRDAGSYDQSSPSQQEELKPDNVELSHGNQYPFIPGNQDYAFDDAQHLNSNFSQTNSHLQNLTPLSNVMEPYNTAPSTLSAAAVHTIREADLIYNPFPGTQSMPAKYPNCGSAVDGSTISMSEALKTAGLSSTQPSPQTIPGTSVANGPPLPQHLAMHTYSQPTIPLGTFTNLMGYPFLPQSYTYLPSAFQQTFASNNTYYQSLAAAAAQYKNSVSASSLPQSDAVASGYGAFGNASSISGNIQMNPPSAQSGMNLSYDEVLSSQYKDPNSHLASLLQNENSALWLQGHNPRTMSAVPASTYFNYSVQSQDPSGFRQGQQQPSLGYANFYHPQTGMTLDHQQQNNARDAAQRQPKQSQIWQNSY